MGGLQIIPYTLWPNAEFARIEGAKQPQERVPVLRIFWTPATLRIKKEQYPNGIVILSEIPLPNDAYPITLPIQETEQDNIDITIEKDQSWPYGKVVLFK